MHFYFYSTSVSLINEHGKDKEHEKVEESAMSTRRDWDWDSPNHWLGAEPLF